MVLFCGGIIVVCAYEKARQELQKKLNAAQHLSQGKDQQCSELESLLCKTQKEFVAVKEKYENLQLKS